MRKTLVLGATSAIGAAVCRLLAADGDRLFLVGRDAAKLKAVAGSLAPGKDRVAGTIAADLNDFERHSAILEEAVRALGGLDLLFIAHGLLGDPAAYDGNPAAVDAVIRTNFLSPAAFLSHAVPRFEKQRSGSIAVVASVAGDRGRRRNYVYGSSKAGLEIYLQGLRARLRPSGVHVLTVKPGYVDTPMVAHLKKGPLFASPETVAKDIRRAILRRREVIYTPGWWAGIMWVVKHAPEWLVTKADG